MLKTRSVFIFDIRILANENNLAFQESTGPVRTATLEPKSHTLQSLAAALGSALNLAGNQVYSVTFDKALRTLTISAATPFTILVATSPFVGSSIHEVLSLGSSDLTGQSSYTTGEIGKLYKPQMPLLDYVDGEDNQRAIDSSINETSGGVVEVIRYGVKKIFEMNIDFVTEEFQSGYIENNKTAISDLREFMEYIVQKNLVEFFPDRDDLDESVTLVLETTPESSQGVGFKIKEKAGLVNYFTTGLLTFRKV
jgi:hypothetical protein